MPIWWHALWRMATHPEVQGATLVVAPESGSTYQAYLEAHPVPKPTVIAPVGGRTRQQSVRNGLQTLPETVAYVAVHDSARPLVSHALLDRLFNAVRVHGAVVPVLPVTDALARTNACTPPTLKQSVDRNLLYRVQTPQVFRREWLIMAHQRATNDDALDDASLVHQAGYPVATVDGDPYNLKLTTPEDLALLRLYAGETGSVRTGIGYDIHTLTEGRKLMLGGVAIPFSKGLLGHSDADVVLHALCDALLGATALDDIGHHFPNTDPRWKDCSSLTLLQAVKKLLDQAGYRIQHIDATIIAEAPKLAPYLPAMRTQIAQTLEILPVQVSLKATTNEGMDSIGQGHAIACFAVATVQHQTTGGSL